jgi:hypothetical protein
VLDKEIPAKFDNLENFGRLHIYAVLRKNIPSEIHAGKHW